jgi:hypothetical protein
MQGQGQLIRANHFHNRCSYGIIRVMVGVARTIGSRQGRRRRRLTVLATIAVVVFAFGYAGWYQLSYGSLPGQLPERITWCGRDYAKSGGQTPELVAGAPLGDRVLTVPRLWSPWPVYTTVNPDARHTDRPCAFVLYLRSSQQHYVHYVLQGGP